MLRGALALLLAIAAAPTAAQESGSEPQERRLPNQRERIEMMRRERRAFVPPPPPSEEQLADERAQTAFEDPYLAPGDVVVTRQGYFLYRGTPYDRERQPQDFVRIERRAAGR